MGNKDITEKQLIRMNDVFADIMNAIVFDGKQCVSEDELSEASTWSSYRDPIALKYRNQERDAFKIWKYSKVNILLTGVGLQSEEDEDMPFRIISYDGAAYRSQIANEARTRRKNRKNVKVNQVRRKRFPVITLVLYFGEKKWSKPLFLKQSFEPPLPNNDEWNRVQEFIGDYKVNLIDVPRLDDDTIEKFQSDFKHVAYFFARRAKDKGYEPDFTTMRHVDEFFDLVDAIGNVAELSGMKNAYKIQKEQEEMSMAWGLTTAEKRVWNNGVERGMDNTLKMFTQVSDELKSGKSKEDLIAEGIDIRVINLVLGMKEEIIK